MAQHQLRRVLVVLGVVAVVVGVEVRAQSIVDSFEAADVQVTAVALSPAGDGGCAARWCGQVPSTDGGAALRACTDFVDLKAAGNLNRCEQLQQAGQGRLLKALRFDVDAGAQ